MKAQTLKIESVDKQSARPNQHGAGAGDCYHFHFSDGEVGTVEWSDTESPRRRQESFPSPKHRKAAQSREPQLF